MMPRHLALPCPFPLYPLPARAVVYWYVLGPLVITLEKGRGVELYHAVVSGTAVPAPPRLFPVTRCCVWVKPLSGLRLTWVGGVECMMPRRLTRLCPLPLYSLPAHAVVYWYVLDPLAPTVEKGRGVELYDAAMSGTAMPAPLLVECMIPRCVVRIRPPGAHGLKRSRG